MWEYIAGILTVLAFVGGYLLFFKNWRENSSLESLYSKFFDKVNLYEELPTYPKNKKPFVLVETGGKYESIRTFVKRNFGRLIGITIPNIIYVAHKNTPEKRKAYLIQSVICNNLGEIDILDDSFYESLINYYSYKLCWKDNKIENNVTQLLKRDFENSRYGYCITKFDNKNFEDKIIVNPPPEKKSLLNDLILPLVLDQNRKSKKLEFAELQQKKIEIMQIIKNICSEICGILFIGTLPYKEYISLFDDCKNKYGSLLLGARGTYIDFLSTMTPQFKKKFGQPCKEIILEGDYKFKYSSYIDKKGTARYKYIYLSKT